MLRMRSKEFPIFAPKLKESSALTFSRFNVLKSRKKIDYFCLSIRLFPQSIVKEGIRIVASSKSAF